MKLTEREKQEAVDLFRSVQQRLGALFESVDGTSQVQSSSWERPANPSGTSGGGGALGIIRGPIVEKAGANVSVVNGDRYPEMGPEHPDLPDLQNKPYFAAGVSTITHMFNPHAPIAHMNIRLFEVGERFWVGGGADLTPLIRYDEDTALFHAAMRDACDGRPSGDYERFKAWCDEYFYIPHRQDIRGVGGIFFDYLQGDFSSLLSFLEAVSTAYIKVYGTILRRRKDTPFSNEEKERQLRWRGRYAEFNLVYDRGTKFSLMTGGNVEAITVALPPVVKW